MANMKDLANLLEVEIGEEFRLKDSSCPYRITNESMEYKDDGGKWCHITYADTILDLLNGNNKIIKQQWKPKYDDHFYAVDSVHNTIVGDIWKGTTFDYVYYAIGNCFRTREDAEKHKEEIINHLKSTYDNGRCEISKD